MASLFRTTGTFIITLSLFTGSFASLVTPLTAQAAGTYHIAVTTTTFGALSISLTGTASATGLSNTSNQNVAAINWGEGTTSPTQNLTLSNFADGGSSPNKFFSVNWAGSHTYATPGPKIITIEVCHSTCTGHDGSESATVVLNAIIPLVPINHAPVADGQSVSTNEDIALPITLTGSDSDNNNITFAKVSNPLHGILSVLNAMLGTVTYTPALNFHGTDSFTFKV